MRFLSEMPVRLCRTVRNTVNPGFERVCRHRPQTFDFGRLGPVQRLPPETPKPLEASTSGALVFGRPSAPRNRWPAAYPALRKRGFRFAVRFLAAGRGCAVAGLWLTWPTRRARGGLSPSSRSVMR